MEKEFPRYYIGYTKNYIDMFLTLLGKGEQSARESLSLLETLPINYEIRENLKSEPLKGKITDWNAFMGWEG